MYGEATGRDYLAPLASVEDLSRVNTPGGSPSPRPRQRHPALEDPNWEPPEDTAIPGAPQNPGITIEPDFLTPLQENLDVFNQGPEDRLVWMWVFEMGIVGLFVGVGWCGLVWG